MRRLIKEVVGIFRIDFKSNVNKVNLICAVIFFLLCSAILHMSIGNHLSLKKKNIEFIEVEKIKFHRYVNYTIYGIRGYLVSLQNSPIFSLFKNSSCFSDLEVVIDAGEKLKINKPQNDGNIFVRPTGGSLDLSWFILTILTGLILTWGFFTFRNSGSYFKFLHTFAAPKSVFIGIFLSRALLIFSFLIIEFFISTCIFLINGINILNEMRDLLVFLLVTYVVMIFLLPVGFILGTIKNTTKAVISMVLVWLIVVLLWPEVLNTIFSKKAGSNIASRYQHQIRKLEILTDFEKLILEKSKEAKTRQEMIELNRSLTEQYWNEGFKKIESLELKRIEAIRKNAKRFHLLSIFNPVTFYKSVNNELSSMGYNEYLRFYRESLEKFKGFTRFYMDNILYKKNPKVVSYLKDDEFVFKAKSSLPKYFGTGLILNFGYILILLFFSYHRFKKVIYPKPENAEAFSELNLNFKKGKHYKIAYDRDEDFNKQLYNLFSGRDMNFTWKIYIDDHKIEPKQRQDFMYIPSPNFIPGSIKVKNMISLVCKTFSLSKAETENLMSEIGDKLLNKHFGDLAQTEKVEVLIKLATRKKPEIYMMNNLFSDIPKKTENEFFERVLAELRSSKDKLILELDSSNTYTHMKYDYYSLVHLVDSVYKERKVKS